jgi:hypothetical protein
MPVLESPTLRELRSITLSAARDILERLAYGYTDKSGAGYTAALTNADGCKLAQKGANRKVSLRFRRLHTSNQTDHHPTGQRL